MSGLTRRRALAAAVAAPLILRAAPAVGADNSADAALVTELLRAELLLQRSYEACTSGPRAPARIARRFKRHEDQHVAALAQALEALGAPGVPPPRRLPVRARRSGRGRLRYLLALEESTLRLMHDAVGRLSDDKLLQTTATILGCQAQHLVVLRRALGREPLRGALEAGRR